MISDCAYMTQFVNVFIFLQGREVAESARQHVDPQDELQIGRKIKEYQQNPQDAQVRMDIGSARGGHGGPSAPTMTGPISRARGKVLDEDVQSGRYVFKIQLS